MEERRGRAAARLSRVPILRKVWKHRHHWKYLKELALTARYCGGCDTVEGVDGYPAKMVFWSKAGDDGHWKRRILEVHFPGSPEYIDVDAFLDAHPEYLRSGTDLEGAIRRSVAQR